MARELPVYRQIRQELARSGAKCALLRIERLEELREELGEFARTQTLNEFQRWIFERIYRLTAPPLDFTPRSILLVSVPSYCSQPVSFSVHGRTLRLRSTGYVTDPSNAGERLLSRLESLCVAAGHRLRHEPRLPRKRLAARSGLARYGRNNITYVKGMGSYHILAPFFTTIPCEQDGWTEVRNAKACEGCGRCIGDCPTGAIRPDRFLIDSEKCITRYSEWADYGAFPDFIPPQAHNCVFECLLCQQACPMNRPYRNRTAPPVHFDEEETALLLEGRPFAQLPAALRRKTAALGWEHCIRALPRNLRYLCAI